MSNKNGYEKREDSGKLNSAEIAVMFFAVEWAKQCSSGSVFEHLDIGCGNAIISRKLSKMIPRYRSVGIDAEKQATAVARKFMRQSERENVSLVRASFTDLPFVKSPRFHLITAINSMPFCPPERFEELWENVHKMILPGGHFAVTLYGPNCDRWIEERRTGKIKTRSIHSRNDVEKLTGDLIWAERGELFDLSHMGFWKGESHYWEIYLLVFKK